MNLNRHKIYTVFELFGIDKSYIDFYDRKDIPAALWLNLMQTEFCNIRFGGEFRDIGTSENDLWDWKREEEKYGNIIFWLKNLKDIYALSLPRRNATIFHGLIAMSGTEFIHTMWK